MVWISRTGSRNAFTGLGSTLSRNPLLLLVLLVPCCSAFSLDPAGPPPALAVRGDSAVASVAVAAHGRGLSGVTVDTFSELVSAVAHGAELIRLHAGTFNVTSTLIINRSVTIMADSVDGSVVLDGLGERQVLSIEGGGVRLVGLNITRGSAANGGGVHVVSGSSVSVEQCNFIDNEATGSYPDGGGGVSVSNGSVHFAGCNINGNQATVRWRPFRTPRPIALRLRD